MASCARPSDRYLIAYAQRRAIETARLAKLAPTELERFGARMQNATLTDLLLRAKECEPEPSIPLRVAIVAGIVVGALVWGIILYLMMNQV